MTRGTCSASPTTGGTTGILYNKTCLPDPATSWAVLGDPGLAGRVAMDVDPTAVIAAGLKELGYSLNSGDERQLAETAELLKQHIGASRIQFVSISEEARDMISSGELCATQAYNGDAAFEIADHPDLGFFVPREGSDLDMSAMAIPRNAKNKKAAEAFINFVLRPEVHASITDYTGYANPNRAAVEEGLIDSSISSDPVSYPDTSGLEAWEVFDGDRRALWNKTWADVQAATAALSAQ